MTRSILASLLAMCFCQVTFADENIQCSTTSVQRFVPIEQTPATTEVVRSEIRAVRTMVMEGDTKVFHTRGTNLDDVGQIESTYQAVRRTNTSKLGNGNTLEVSNVQSTTTYPNGRELHSQYEMTVEFEPQVDGTRKTVRATQAGKEIPDSGFSFSVISPSGVEFESYYNDKPETYEFDSGVLTVLLQKQICSITTTPAK